MGRKKPAPASGLVWRNGRAYFDRRHTRFEGGRLAISLRTTDPTVAAQRHGVLLQLMDRGDWGVLEAIRRGEMHITDAQAALRDGDSTRLKRMGAQSPTLGEALERFLARKDATRAASTVALYRSRIGTFVKSVGADTRMEEVTSAKAREYLQEPKPDKPWAPSTQEVTRVTIGALWTMVMEEEAESLAAKGIQPAVRVNPWAKLDMPEVRKTRTVFLLPEEWRTLDRSMVGQPCRAMIALAYLAGLRQSEIRHLRTDVDVLLGEEPLIRVQSRGGKHPWRPKTRRGERDVPIPDALVDILEDHTRRGYAGSRYMIRVPGKDQPIAANTATRWTEEAYGAAGIQYGREGDGLTLHSGRHTYASWLAQDGVPLNVVADLLGDTMEVVRDTYAHLVPDTYRSAVQHVQRRAQSQALPEGGSE